MDERRYAGSNLNKAEAVFAEAIYHRPRIRLTIRQRTLVLEQWPVTPGRARCARGQDQGRGATRNRLGGAGLGLFRRTTRMGSSTPIKARAFPDWRRQRARRPPRWHRRIRSINSTSTGAYPSVAA